MASSCRPNPAGSMLPTQIGAVLKPTKAEIIKLDREYQGVTPADDMYRTLPCKMLNNREWTLPDSHQYFIHTHRYMKGERHQRRIEGTNAYWNVQGSGSGPVADDFGQKIGEETIMTLMFAKRGEQDTMGIWKARDYRSLDNNGKSAMVTLLCTDPKLVELEKQVKAKEYELWGLRQERLEYQHVCDEGSVRDTEVKIDAMVIELTDLKEFLKEEKDFARRTEERNAGVGIGIGLV